MIATKNIHLRGLLTYAVVLMALFSSSKSYAQSGWVKEKNEGYAKVSFSFFSSGDYYGLGGELNSTATEFNYNAVNLYGEYGITKRLTTTVNFPVYRSNSLETSELVSGIGDVRIGIKYGILRGKYPLSLSVSSEIPTGKEMLFANSKMPDPISGLINTINLPTGDGEFNVWTTLAVSRSLHPVPVYLSLYASHNNRTEDFTDQFQWGFEAGYIFSEAFMLRGKLTQLTTLGDDINPNVNFIFGEGTEYMSYSFEAAYRFIENWNVEIGYLNYFGSDFVERKNIYAAPSFTVGISYEF